jgi:hypothetical protein
MKPQYILLLAASLLLCINANSQESQAVNRCVLNGKTVYQAESCPNSSLQNSNTKTSKNLKTQQESKAAAEARRMEQTRRRDEIQKGFSDSSFKPATAYLLSVPSDSKAEFFVLHKGGGGTQRTILTKRVGPSGVSYSERLFNCANNTGKYLGTGNSLTEMAASKADPNMGSIVNGSIAYYIGLEACK